MGKLQGEILAILHEIRRITAADFAAVAWTDALEQRIKWQHASGSRNERYKRIQSTLGKGLIGDVFRSGRPLVIEEFSPRSGDDPQEYPILLAENLKSMVCVPVTENAGIVGVLLVGCRETRKFTGKMIELVSNSAQQLAAMKRNKLQA